MLLRIFQQAAPPPGSAAKRQGRAAFTLTELMVVVAVIAALALLMLPVFRYVTLQNQANRCLGNLRSTGLLMTAYISDHQGRLVTFVAGSPATAIWTRRLIEENYISKEDALKTLRCPYGETQYAPFEGTLWYWEGYGLLATSDELTFSPGGSPRLMTLQPGAITNPSSHLLMADSAGASGRYQTFRIMNRYNTGGTLALRHGGQANGYFLDGHMERIDRQRALDLGLPPDLITTPE